MCRNQLRKSWTNDCIKALMEPHQPKHERDHAALDNEPIILYKDYLKDNQKWKLGKIIGQIKGKDSIVHGYKIKTGNGYIIECQFNLLRT